MPTTYTSIQQLVFNLNPNLNFANFPTSAPSAGCQLNPMKQKIVIEIPPYYIDTLSRASQAMTGLPVPPCAFLCLPVPPVPLYLKTTFLEPCGSYTHFHQSLPQSHIC
jgi:hypothetical protein